ncbi:hypothetical protein N7509_011472, partial [Penicillium cosmopolitanum]
ISLRLLILSPKATKLKLSLTVTQRQEKMLELLPRENKLLITLNCWTSLFQQAFINYRELLLSFEPLSGEYLGPNLAKVLIIILQKHKLLDRVLTVTTDNISNNKTLIQSLHESEELEPFRKQIQIVWILCLTYVIQLALNQLLGRIKASPKNDTTEKRVSWKKLMLTALEAVQEKLDKYYSQTYDSYSDLFAIATILHPQKKLRFFTTRE